MAEQGFQRNVTQNINVPKSKTPTQSTGGSSLEGIADIASIGLNIYSNVQAGKKAARVAEHEESLAQEALDLNTLKLNMKDQEIGSVKQNASINKKLKKC